MAAAVFQQGSDEGMDQTIVWREADKGASIVAVESVFGADPDVAVVVLKECPDDGVGQAVHGIQAVPGGLANARAADDGFSGSRFFAQAEGGLDIDVRFDLSVRQ